MAHDLTIQSTPLMYRNSFISIQLDSKKIWPTAIGAFLIVGSVVAAGCSFSTLGSYAYVIGGGGSAVGVVCIVAGRYLFSDRKSSVGYVGEKALTSSHPGQTPICKKVFIPPSIPLPAVKAIPSSINIIKNPQGLISMDQLGPSLMYLGDSTQRFTYHGFITLDSFLVENYDSDCLVKSIQDADPEQHPYQVFGFSIRFVHWTVGILDHTKGVIEYYDSLGSQQNRFNVSHVLERIKNQYSTADKPYKIKYMIDEPLQRNGHRCGVWVFAFVYQRFMYPQAEWKSLSAQESFQLEERYLHFMQAILLACYKDRHGIEDPQLPRDAAQALKNSGLLPPIES